MKVITVTFAWTDDEGTEQEQVYAMGELPFPVPGIGETAVLWLEPLKRYVELLIERRRFTFEKKPRVRVDVGLSCRLIEESIALDTTEE